MNAIEKKVIDKAIAVMQKRGVPVSQPADRIIEMPRMCAQHGKQYFATYREDNGVWKFKECVRATAGTGSAGMASKIMTVGQKSMEGVGREVCPWCGTGPKLVGATWTAHVKCSRCKNIVCMARTEGEIFRCSDQCGLEGPMGGHFKGYDAAMVRRPLAGLLTGAFETKLFSSGTSCSPRQFEDAELELKSLGSGHR